MRNRTAATNATHVPPRLAGPQLLAIQVARRSKASQRPELGPGIYIFWAWFSSADARVVRSGAALLDTGRQSKTAVFPEENAEIGEVLPQSAKII